MKIKERKETFRTFCIGFPIDDTNTWGKQLESERVPLAWIEGTVYHSGEGMSAEAPERCSCYIPS